MFKHEDNFEEEFSNWAKAVLNLQNVRNGSISYIKKKMEPFIDELVHMHGPDEEDHFKELLIKVAVNGEVKKKKSKKNTNEHSWALYDKKCATCVDVFKKILDNFKDSCPCKRWERHASKKPISPSDYWWIVSKLYVSHNCEIETSLGPKEVEPFAVLSLMSRCRLFHENLIWFDVGQVILSRHELMHSIDNRLSDDKRDKYLLEMKTLIKNVAVDSSTTEVFDTSKVLKAFEEVENLTVTLFTEDGEIHKLANKALQLQFNYLNADFKSPKGVHATMKSLAMFKIESKRQESKLNYEDLLKEKEYELQKMVLERKNEELKTQINQHKIDELERKLQDETENNKTYEENLADLKSNMENKFEHVQHEKSKQDDKLSSIETKMENKFEDLQHEKSKQDDKLSSIETKMENKFKDLEQEKSKQQDDGIVSLNNKILQMVDDIRELKQDKSKQGTEISSFDKKMENKFKDLQQETSKQDDDISSLNNKILQMVDDIRELKQDKSKQDTEISSLDKKMENKLKDLQQEIRQQDEEISSLKSKISTSHIYKVQSFSDVSVGVDSDEETCSIRDMCQMSDGTVLLIDDVNNKLKRLDYQLKVKDCYPFKNTPTYVATMGPSQVAVLNNKWKIVSLMLGDTIIVERKVVLKGKPNCEGGMIYCNNQFWIHCSDGLYVYSSSGSLVKRIENSSLDLLFPFFIRTIHTNTYKSRVYVIKADAVYVFNTDGEVLFTITLIDEALNMTITIDDILIVSNALSGNIDMYDKHGTGFSRLVSKTNMLAHPRSMLYDEKKCCLIIGFRWENKIRVFQLEKLPTP